MLYQSDRLRLESVNRAATLWIESPVATRGLLDDLARVLNLLGRSPFLDVLVIRGPGTGFLTGPDLDEIDSLTDGESVRGFAAAGQNILSRLEALSETMPTVAYIDGPCRGAGLELALACDYRLAVTKPETLFGCDALERGLFPCWGLTQRLPRLIGVDRALDLMLNERRIPARAARQLGLVDHAFGSRPAKTELWSFVADLQDRPRVPNRGNGRRGFWSRLREGRPIVRQTAIRTYSRSFVRPDQQALIRAAERGWFAGFAEGEAVERAALRAFVCDPESRQRRERAREFENAAVECQTAGPQRWGFVGMGPEAVELGLLLVRSGHSITFSEGDARTRETGLREFEAGLKRCQSDGWFNVVEAEQKRKGVGVLTHELRLESADVQVVCRAKHDRKMFSCRPGREWGSAEWHVTLQFDGSPLSARTVAIDSDDESVEFAAGLMNALARCGKRIERRFDAAPIRAQEFAA